MIAVCPHCSRRVYVEPPSEEDTLRKCNGCHKPYPLDLVINIEETTRRMDRFIEFAGKAERINNTYAMNHYLQSAIYEEEKLDRLNERLNKITSSYSP